MDDAEKELWCRAWRLLLQHGDDTAGVIDAEFERALRERDSAGVTAWRKIADAVEALSK